ncbi:hypothetical protein HYY74_05870 [Candidatus Woesearchaeota archaeon]|nr:hypothetical protein [Candidatus Woesearchaeota archaeon]
MAHTVNHRQDGRRNYSAAATALFGVTPNFFKAYSGNLNSNSGNHRHSAQIPLHQPPAPTYVPCFDYRRSLFPGAGSFRPDRYYAGKPDLEARMLEPPNASEPSHLQQNPVAAASTWQHYLQVEAVVYYLPRLESSLPVPENVVPVTAASYRPPLEVTLMAYGPRGVDPTIQPQVGRDGSIQRFDGPARYNRNPLEEYAGKHPNVRPLDRGQQQMRTPSPLYKAGGGASCSVTRSK